MRLDAHMHVYTYATIEAIRSYATAEGITHYVAIMRDEALHLVDRLDDAGARGIPFHWIGPEAPGGDAPGAGYKVHPRLVPFTEGALDPICERAAREGRPLLFHTDADEPHAYAGNIPLLAEVAGRHPHTTIICAHLGVYTQEFYLHDYTPEEWQPLVEGLFRRSFELLLDQENLYADTTRFGSDFPARSPDPEHRYRMFAKVVGELSPAARKALLGKLFVGTDFPHFCDPEDPAYADLPDSDHLGAAILKSTYHYQAACMRAVFGADFDEEEMARRFLRLLPEEHARLGRSQVG